MTTTDRWLLERAEKRKNEDSRARKDARAVKAGAFRATFDAEVGAVWQALVTEVERQAGVFNTAAGNPQALIVTGDAGHIRIDAEDGRQLTIRLDRAARALVESYRNSAGATRTTRPRIGFRVDSEGRLAFNFGVVQSAAGSILRRVID